MLLVWIIDQRIRMRSVSNASSRGDGISGAARRTQRDNRQSLFALFFIILQETARSLFICMPMRKSGVFVHFVTRAEARSVTHRPLFRSFTHQVLLTFHHLGVVIQSELLPETSQHKGRTQIVLGVHMVVYCPVDTEVHSHRCAADSD